MGRDIYYETKKEVDCIYKKIKQEAYDFTSDTGLIFHKITCLIPLEQYNTLKNNSTHIRPSLMRVGEEFVDGIRIIPAQVEEICAGTFDKVRYF